MPFVKLQERVVTLISKGCQQRGERDIDMVLPWLRKKSELLQGLDTGMISFPFSDNFQFTKAKKPINYCNEIQSNCEKYIPNKF